MKIDTNLPAPENCPSFSICFVNDCPLEKKPNKYQTLPEDKKLWNYKKCRCGKPKRMAIAKAYNIKSLGLTLRELANMKRSIQMKQQIFSTRDNKIESPKTSIDIGVRE